MWKCGERVTQFGFEEKTKIKIFSFDKWANDT
jgi:hypothetical protein